MVSVGFLLLTAFLPTTTDGGFIYLTQSHSRIEGTLPALVGPSLQHGRVNQTTS